MDGKPLDSKTCQLIPAITGGRIARKLFDFCWHKSGGQASAAFEQFWQRADFPCKMAGETLHGPHFYCICVEGGESVLKKLGKRPNQYLFG